MKVENYEEGVPYWVDLGAEDPAAAAEFYGTLFGWECPEGPPKSGGYRVCLLRGVPVAGISPKAAPGPSAWRTYVNVADADKIASKVTKAGGRILVSPVDVLTDGRMGVFADTMGATFGVWQLGEHKGAGVVNEPGAYVWSELITDDVNGSAAFYGAVFGWGVTAPSPKDPLQRREWQVRGRSMAGMLPRPPAMPAEMQPYWDVYFEVADTNATVKEAARLGGTVLMPSTDIGHGHIAVFIDPAGRLFSVMTPAHGAA
jgi:predicted enzyme related to lactoylglutathione lyase